jgi:hypothetical protein
MLQWRIEKEDQNVPRPRSQVHFFPIFIVKIASGPPSGTIPPPPLLHSQRLSQREVQVMSYLFISFLGGW